MLQINLDTLPATLIGGALTAVAIIGYRSLLAVNRLIYQVGTIIPPTGILGEQAILKREFESLRDWAIQHGYDRRQMREET